MAELTEKNISNENDGKGLEALKNLQNEQENKDVVQEEITKKLTELAKSLFKENTIKKKKKKNKQKKKIKKN